MKCKHCKTDIDNLAKVMKVPNVSVALPFATAAQRAEAFLKTLNLWTP
jgi:hypothetical protein